MSEITLGGERLGSGNKTKVHLRNYERSTHDLSYVWRSSMASGTLVPFMNEVGLPGDNFDIDLSCHVLTHPTIGPLFGSYKVQLDVFQVPVRLYQGQLHMNKLGIGNRMQDVHLPQMNIVGKNLDITKNLDNQQINSSCIFSYLNIRGVGNTTDPNYLPQRNFNAVTYLGYWDIYKNYYANKQEEEGAVIHNPLQILEASDIDLTFKRLIDPTIGALVVPQNENGFAKIMSSSAAMMLDIYINPSIDFHAVDLGKISIQIKRNENSAPEWISAEKLFLYWTPNGANRTYSGTIPDYDFWDGNLNVTLFIANYIVDENPEQEGDIEPKITRFPLENIDMMREEILKAVQQGTPFMVSEQNITPYNLPFKKVINAGATNLWSMLSNQEGLGLKTYQSDLLQNWISTEWIDGDNGINEITKVDTTDGGFTIDELVLSRKIYDMLNRIAISGGSYDDWLDAVYTHDRQRSAENPIYMGGLIRELSFQEVISNSASESQPLGTLAGRGSLTDKRKGGSVKIRIDEPSYIMGIVSITPRLDYSQGNKWDVNLKTMDDFHKPALDEIGFQDLITDQMAWWDTNSQIDSDTYFKSAGKQPAWINYMTNVNQVRGNFAVDTDQMFMTLTRRYEPQFTTAGVPFIKDLTTYIDPVKFNHIFAYTRRDAQNFWVQIGLDIKARRKMSAKVMPNL